MSLKRILREVRACRICEAHLPFGGVKQTGNGHREGGWEVYEFYSETKVGYVDFSGTLQRAHIDNYGDDATTLL